MQDYEQRIIQSLRQLIHAVDLDSRQLASEHQITGPQLACLTAVSRLRQPAVSELAQAVHLHPSTVVGILDRLAEKGLIERRRDEADRRVVKVRATPRGRRQVAKEPSRLRKRLARKLDGLSGRRREQLARALEELVELLGAEDLSAPPLPGMEAD